MDGERPLRVLFVDDEPATCKIGALHLEKAGYAVEVAANGAEGFVAAMGSPPDIIISDIMMPVMDGVEFLAKIRGEKSLRDCYVILLTSKDRVRDVVEGFEAEADDYVTKPFQLTELLARVKAGARVKRVQDELRLANERLRGSLRQLAEVIGVAAHEMRGPLHLIDHYAALIGTDGVSAEQIREICTRHAHALSGILDGLLDLSRIDMGEVRLTVEETALPDACAELSRLYEPLAAEKRIALSVEAEDGAVYCDRQRLVEMLGILAENAFLLCREESAVRLAAAIRDDEAVFRMELETPAVTVGEARALLALSLREENVPVTPGLQVGFAILQKLAAIHGGRLFVESPPGAGGLAFGFALPHPSGETAEAARERIAGREPAAEAETA
jgi:CheY-like chemotaxis protein